MTSHLRAFRADRPLMADEPKYFTRILDDIYEDPRIGALTRDIFGHLVKGNRGSNREVRITQPELAARARVCVKTVANHLKILERCGYIRRERVYTANGLRKESPHLIFLCYELRAVLKLEESPPIATGSRNRCNRNGGSGSKRNPHSGCNRNGGSGPSLFEQRESLETTTEGRGPGSSSSFQSSDGGTGPGEPEPATKAPESPTSNASAALPAIPPPTPPIAPRAAQADPSMAAMLAMAVERWPHLAPELPGRIADLAAAGQKTWLGTEGAALILEYVTRQPNADGPGLAFNLLTSWSTAGKSIDDVREIVQCRRNLDKPVPRSGPAPSPGAYQRPDYGPVDPDEERKKAEVLAEWRRKGILRGSGAGLKEPAAGPVAKPSPQPAGVAFPGSANRTVNIDPWQEKSARKQAFEGRASPVIGPKPGEFA